MVVPKGTVHACFNTSGSPLKLFVVLSPLLDDVGEEWIMGNGYGWEMVDVSGVDPWASLR